MREAYHAESALTAEGLLTELGKTHPGAPPHRCAREWPKP
jgi:hypothetical protein